MERPLRERRERADLLDLVTEELDAERFAAGRREHVDDPAADRELTALVDALDPLVAGEREVLGEAVDARLVADAQLERGRACLDGGHPFGERRRRGAHEPSRREDVERPVALAHEVGRRHEAGVVRDAASGKQRDALGAEEPAGASAASRASASSGSSTSSPRPELLVERREEERQHRLGDAGPGRQRSRERLEALVPAELVDEGGERYGVGAGGGRVHAVRRGSRPAGPSYRGSTLPRRRPRTRRRTAPDSARTPTTAPQGHPRCPAVTLSAKS